MIILGWMQPYQELGKWKRELLNEYFITLTIYHVMCFTSGNSVEMRQFMGYSFCFFLAIHVLGNIAFIMYMSGKATLWGLKKAKIVKNELQRVQKLQDKNKENRHKMAKGYVKRRGKYVEV